MLDNDHEGQSPISYQVFFPAAGIAEGGTEFARNRGAKLHRGMNGACRGTIMVLFDAKEQQRAAVCRFRVGLLHCEGRYGNSLGLRWGCVHPDGCR